MDSPPRPVRVTREPVGAKNKRKLNFVPTDPELLTTKQLWRYDPSKPTQHRPSVSVPFTWPNGTVSRKSRKNKSKKSRRTRKY